MRKAVVSNHSIYAGDHVNRFHNYGISKEDLSTTFQSIFIQGLRSSYRPRSDKPGRYNQ
jgi:hypothetical protein